MTGDHDIAWLAGGIAETVTSDLAALDAFQVIDRWRVVRASRDGAASAQDVGAALGLACVVVGSYQRQGPNLRITARLLDLARGTAIADVKLDGPLADAFALQDGIVSSFVRDLGLTRAASPARTGARETASLEAYRALHGRPAEAREPGHGSRAGRDPGLRAARSRLDPQLRRARTPASRTRSFVACRDVAPAQRKPNDRRACASASRTRGAPSALDPALGEAHATLSFLLVSAGQLRLRR